MMKTLPTHLRGGRPGLGTLCVLLMALSCALLLVPRTAAAKDGAKLERPVMMDSDGPGTELYVLDNAGILHRFRVSDNGLSEYGSFALPPDFKPADMTFARTEKPASMLIAGSQLGRGVVVLFSLDGKSLRTWEFKNVCSGVDSGESGHAAYVATSDSNEIYKVDMQGSRSTLLAHIDSATKLGPVAFDEARHEIYVADIAAGKIFQYGLLTRTSKLFVSGLSAPTALAFDARTNRLFVADPGQRAIFTVDTLASKPAIARFAADPLRAPYGMTLISNGRVAVADYSANSVLVFSEKGALLFRYPSAP